MRFVRFVQRYLPALMLLAVAAAPAVALAQSPEETTGPRSWWLPRNVSTTGATIDALFDFILWMTMIVGVALFIVMGVFLVKYRYRPHRHAVYIHGNGRLELMWTIIPALLMAGTAAVSQATWKLVKDPDTWPTPMAMVEQCRAPVNAAGEPITDASGDRVYAGDVLHVQVVARQFNWQFHYPGPDGKLGPRRIELIKQGTPEQVIGLDTTHPDAKDDFVTGNMVIPVDKKVYVDLTSNDVIHSFFLPNFRVKQDAVPGLIGKVWFEATDLSENVIGRYALAADPLDQEGLKVTNALTGNPTIITRSKPFAILCAELCGGQHYSMRSSLFVVTAEEYERWHRAEMENVLAASSNEGY